MSNKVVLVSVPALREKDVAAMPKVRELMSAGALSNLEPSFPCVTCPVQAAMTTGRRASMHGVVANGFYWRDKKQVEMWTAPNDCIERPQIWDVLSHHAGGLTSAVWFPLHSKRCEADYVCTPAPIHNPDGSESLWCYTRPTELYGDLRDKLDHFPLKHFWGPLANIQASRWIAESAIYAVERWHPDFFYVYIPHLDYAAQSHGPDSEKATAAVAELDDLLADMIVRITELSGGPDEMLWLIAGEYAITPVDHVTYPNRVLREAGLLTVREEEDGEHLDFAASTAFALVDHQFSHVFVNDADAATIERVAGLFRGSEGIDEVLVGEGDLARYELNHARSGELVLVSTPNSWQQYYWWLDDAKAPGFARTVDIHRKPGYDPVELHIDMATRSIPLDATLIKGSHGAPARDSSQKSVILASNPMVLHETTIADVDVFKAVVSQFGLNLDV